MSYYYIVNLSILAPQSEPITEPSIHQIELPSSVQLFDNHPAAPSSYLDQPPVHGEQQPQAQEFLPFIFVDPPPHGPHSFVHPPLDEPGLGPIPVTLPSQQVNS